MDVGPVAGVVRFWAVQWFAIGVTFVTWNWFPPPTLVAGALVAVLAADVDDWPLMPMLEALAGADVEPAAPLMDCPFTRISSPTWVLSWSLAPTRV